MGLISTEKEENAVEGCSRQPDRAYAFRPTLAYAADSLFPKTLWASGKYCNSIKLNSYVTMTIPPIHYNAHGSKGLIQIPTANSLISSCFPEIVLALTLA